MTRTGLAFFLLFVILTRLPFVFAGFGTDPDAWRVAASATKLWQTGTYEVSRSPGYPLHELVTAPLVALGGAPLSNSGTLLCSLILLLVWHRFVLREGRHPALLLIILAFTPIFWKNSAATTDYIWSLLFILLAFERGLSGKAVMAGVMLGIAAGFRPSNAIAALPVMVPLLSADRPVRAILQFATASILATSCIFAPIILAVGPAAWAAGSVSQVADVRAQQNTGLLVAMYRGVYAFGPLALAFIGVALLGRWKYIRTARVIKDPVLSGALVAVIAYVALFFWLPMEREYLLPVLLFGLLLIDRLCTRRQIIFTGVLLFSFAFLDPDVIAHQGAAGSLQPNLRQGMIIEEWKKHDLREETRATILTLHQSRKALVMTGFPEPYWFNDVRTQPIEAPFHERLYRNLSDSLVFHTFCLSRAELTAAREQGYALCVLRDATRFVEQTGGFSVEQEKVAVLPPSP